MAPPRGPDLLTGQGPGAPAPACTTVAEIGGEPHGEAATQPTQRPDARWVPTRGVPSAWPCRGLPPAVHRSVRARSATASTPGQPNGAGTGERLPVRHARLIRRVNRTGRPGLFWLLPGHKIMGTAARAEQQPGEAAPAAAADHDQARAAGRVDQGFGGGRWPGRSGTPAPPC